MSFGSVIVQTPGKIFSGLWILLFVFGALSAQARTSPHDRWLDSGSTHASAPQTDSSSQSQESDSSSQTDFFEEGNDDSELGTLRVSESLAPSPSGRPHGLPSDPVGETHIRRASVHRPPEAA